MMGRAISLHASDDVAVATTLLSTGQEVAISGPSPVHRVIAATAVAEGHKLALRGLVRGQEVRKYGEVIGHTTVAIPEGAHVHVHNLISQRAINAAAQAEWSEMLERNESRDASLAVESPTPARK